MRWHGNGTCFLVWMSEVYEKIHTKEGDRERQGEREAESPLMCED